LPLEDSESLIRAYKRKKAECEQYKEMYYTQDTEILSLKHQIE